MAELWSKSVATDEGLADSEVVVTTRSGIRKTVSSSGWSVVLLSFVSVLVDVGMTCVSTKMSDASVADFRLVSFGVRLRLNCAAMYFSLNVVSDTERSPHGNVGSVSSAKRIQHIQ